jgi:hypothetical protein
MIHSRMINELKHNFGANINIKSKVRELRKRMTEQETPWGKQERG